jgi:hypothetical protein
MIICENISTDYKKKALAYNMICNSNKSFQTSTVEPYKGVRTISNALKNTDLIFCHTNAGLDLLC